MNATPRMSLLEEAQFRALSLHDDDSSSDEDVSSPQNNILAARSTSLMASTPISTTPYSSQTTDEDTNSLVQYGDTRLPHPLAASAPVLSTPSPSQNSAASLAGTARQEWQSHGHGLTQDLEDKRERSLWMVRILSAEDVVDVAGATYTAYVIRWRQKHESAQQHTTRRRYSDFVKLRDNVTRHGIKVPTAFPAKHWAGRLGSWTPAARMAPVQHEQLVHFRLVQLDVWLVHLLWECSTKPSMPVAVWNVVESFLTETDRLPCQDANPEAAGNWQWNNPLAFTLGSSLRQATRTIQAMTGRSAQLSDTDQSIPADLLQAAKGLCFLTVLKAGMVVSGRVGTGLVVKKLVAPSGGSSWSAPCAVSTVGLGWGAVVGGNVTHYLIVLTTDKAVDNLVRRDASVQLGAELNVAVGPVGRGAHSNVTGSSTDWSLHPAYAYAHSQGLFFGLSLEGSVLKVRSDVNATFYGKKIEDPETLLQQAGPPAADNLYHALEVALQQPIAEGGFRPSRLLGPARLLTYERKDGIGPNNSERAVP